MADAIRATLAVLTRNSSATLPRALESAKDFSDIIVCDGGSTDDTLAIAAEYGARVIQQDKKFLDESGRIFDFSGVRNQTLDTARENWFFFLDSDEYCGEDLITAVRKVVNERTEGSFWVNRKYVVEGVVIDNAATYPNRQMRFFHRNSVMRFIKRVHERIELKAGTDIGTIGTLYVPLGDIASLRRRWDFQIQVEVARRGKMTMTRFLADVFNAGKVSFLWSLRLLRNRLFRGGTHMPFAIEMERHYFHIRLLRALWKIVTF